MLNCGMPASTARQPIALESIGPTVPPLRTSLRIWKTCSFDPHLSATRWRIAVETASVVMWPLESADIATPTFSRGAWLGRYAFMKFGLTACVTSADTRKELAYVCATRFAPAAGEEVKESTIRSIVLGRKLLRAPCRSKLPISSSSNKPTHLMIPEVDSLAVLGGWSKSACTADQEHSLSSTRPP